MTITMPQLGETVTEGTVAQWLKRPGDAVEKYEPFVEVSTDKVNAEVPSPVSGVLREIICKEGETVATGAPIAVIDEAGVEDSPRVAPSEAERHGADEPVPGFTTPVSLSNGNGNGRGNGVAASNGTLRRTSPAVRRLAREHHVDVSALVGTGAGGRVTANDVIAAANVPSAPAAEPVAATVTVAPPARVPQLDASAKSTLVPLTPSRKIIAKRMVESLATAPHAWTMVEVDVTKLWRWRAQEKDRFLAEKGYALTLLPFFIYAVVGALKKQPMLNARFTEEGIEVQHAFNIGIAIGLETNLIVPVIRDADTLSIAGLALAAGKLIEKARGGKLGADDLAGGTFTVNNTGANGSILSKPIINGGQAAIVTMEAVIKRAVVIED
ncbi:MAG: 2-oxo acid dehydrogenase subunit E2, partial [Candidatus Eremiobacteraeota bacterium]|nr:2-oxo acid dehydrogenase subunit E2 [Candidatus Eremiobacteraeota bacterium]